MEQEKAVTPQVLNEALRESEAIRDVATKVHAIHSVHVAFLLFPPTKVFRICSRYRRSVSGTVFPYRHPPIPSATCVGMPAPGPLHTREMWVLHFSTIVNYCPSIAPRRTRAWRAKQ